MSLFIENDAKLMQQVKDAIRNRVNLSQMNISIMAQVANQHVIMGEFIDDSIYANEHGETFRSPLDVFVYDLKGEKRMRLLLETLPSVFPGELNVVTPTLHTSIRFGASVLFSVHSQDKLVAYHYIGETTPSELKKNCLMMPFRAHAYYGGLIYISPIALTCLKFHVYALAPDIRNADGQFDYKTTEKIEKIFKLMNAKTSAEKTFTWRFYDERIMNYPVIEEYTRKFPNTKVYPDSHFWNLANV